MGVTEFGVTENGSAHRRLRPSIVSGLLLNPGNHDEGETPVPIPDSEASYRAMKHRPNTEAKPLGADGTARVAEWESRILPGFYFFGKNGEGA